MNVFGIHFGMEQLPALMGGSVVVFLAVARHMPAPLKSQREVKWPVYAWGYDTIQDLAKNNDRIGETREDATKQLTLPLTSA